jgi:hypothetical protein
MPRPELLQTLWTVGGKEAKLLPEWRSRQLGGGQVLMSPVLRLDRNVVLG